MSKEVKLLRRTVITHLAAFAAGFVFFGAIWCLCVLGYASEIEETAPIVQDEQSETAVSSGSGSSETDEAVQDEQINLESLIPDDQKQVLQALAGELQTEKPGNLEIQPFAGGLIVGELIDLLQEPIENDGYTDESWQRYEDALTAAWNVIGNFLVYTDAEVRVIIDELKAATAGLEYPANNPPALSSELSTDHLIAFGFQSGLLSVMVFSGGLRNAI